MKDSLSKLPIASLMLVLGIGFVGGAGGAATYEVYKNWRKPVELLEAKTGKRAAWHAGDDPQADFTTAAREASPSVVFIKTTSNSRRQNDFWSFWDMWGRGGGNISSAGSGVVMTKDGYIATNYHVIDEADVIEVTLRDKRTFKAKVVGKDPNTDLAVLKIEANDLKPVVLGNSDHVQTGEWVLAIGNPMNLAHTVTAGIVSAKGRNINILNTQFPIESFIQTDAAINPGNSGGALVNSRGELVGINTAISSTTGAYTGYGFAIPVNIVRKVVKDLTEFAEVQRAFTGIEVVDVEGKLAEKVKDNDLNGAYVIDIPQESNPYQAGIREGDVVLKVDNHPVESKAEFLERIAYHRPGDKVKLIVKREGSLKEYTITLVNRDGLTELTKNQTFSSQVLGCEISPLSKMEMQKLGVSAGYRLNNVKRGRLANLGIPEGFVILSINKQSPKSPQDLEKLFQDARGRLLIEGVNPGGGRGTYQFFSY